jgi:hypothetical protein
MMTSKHAKELRNANKPSSMVVLLEARHLERLDYEDKPVASVAEDLWKGKATKKRRSVLRRQDISQQEVEVIAQQFLSNYAPPPPKRKE